MWVGVHHRIPQHIISLNANFQFLNTFSSKVINPWHFLCRRGTLWRHRWYLVLNSILVWVHHRIPHLTISLKINLKLHSPFSAKVINTCHFLGLRGTLWRHRWYLVLKCFLVWVHHRIPQHKISLNANFQFPNTFSWKVINPWHFLCRRGTLWRHRGYLVLKMLWVGVHHRIPHPKISLKINLQLPSPFSSKVINTWYFLGLRGTLWRHRWYLVLKCFLVWVHHRISHFKMSLKVNLQLPSHFSSKVINTWHFFGPTLWRRKWYLVWKLMWVGVHHRIPQHIISLNANFQFLNTFSSKVINPWHFLCRRGTLWRHRWYLVLNSILVWVHHRIPHLTISLKINLKLHSPFSAKVINTCHFLGLRGTLWRHRWYLVLKCFLVWVHHGIPHLKISLKVNLQPIPFSSKVINTWHFLGLRGILWRHRWHLVLKSFFVRVHHGIPYPKFFSPPICNFLVHFLQKLLTLGTF